MELTKSNIKKTLENVNISGSAENIVSSGILKNIQVFGDQVDIDLILSKRLTLRFLLNQRKYLVLIL